MFQNLFQRKTTTVRRLGFTLVEVLVALTMTLIVLGAMARAFSFASEQMQQGRASLEMSSRLRTTLNLVRSDMESLTVEARPYHFDSSPPNGYFEMIDGGKTDGSGVSIDDTTTPSVNENTLYSLAVGDYDDVLAGTIKSEGRSYRGRLTDPMARTGMVESQLAEVIWFTLFGDADVDGFVEPVDGDRVTLYRRQLLIRPNLQTTVDTAIANGVFGSNQNATSLAVNFFSNNDISARIEPVVGTSPQEFTIALNTLEDLGRRHNRFAHQRPNGLLIPQTSLYRADFARRFLASNEQDVMLTDVLAFDLKVFAPDATALVSNNFPRPRTRQINDIAYPGEFGSGRFEKDVDGNSAAATFLEETGATPNVIPLSGSFVDLGRTGASGASGASGGVPGSPSSGASGGVLGSSSSVMPLSVGGLSIPDYTEAVFETGTPWYNTVAFPQANNGIDDHTGSQDGLGVVDDLNEKIRPPFDTNIRGLEVGVRIWERTSNQIRQATARVSFISE